MDFAEYSEGLTRVLQALSPEDRLDFARRLALRVLDAHIAALAEAGATRKLEVAALWRSKMREGRQLGRGEIDPWIPGEDDPSDWSAEQDALSCVGAYLEVDPQSVTSVIWVADASLNVANWASTPDRVAAEQQLCLDLAQALLSRRFADVDALLGRHPLEWRV